MLSNSFEDNEVVKALGAHFDWDRRSWYVPPGKHLQPFAKWIGADDVVIAAANPLLQEPPSSEQCVAAVATGVPQAQVSSLVEAPSIAPVSTVPSAVQVPAGAGTMVASSQWVQTPEMSEALSSASPVQPKFQAAVRPDLPAAPYAFPEHAVVSEQVLARPPFMASLPKTPSPSEVAQVSADAIPTTEAQVQVEQSADLIAGSTVPQTAPVVVATSVAPLQGAQRPSSATATGVSMAESVEDSGDDDETLLEAVLAFERRVAVENG